MHCFQTERIATPVGNMILVARDGVLLLLEFEDATERVAKEMRARFGDVRLEPASNPFGLGDRVRDYFAGDLHALDQVLCDGGGTAFEQKVWAELRKIPLGTTISYGELANRIGNPNGSDYVLGPNVVAGNPKVYENLLELIRPLVPAALQQ